jgi:hypothetical protein
MRLKYRVTKKSPIQGFTILQPGSSIKRSLGLFTVRPTDTRKRILGRIYYRRSKVLTNDSN